MTYSQTMTAVLFIVFLGRLLCSTTGKIILIVDRLKVHAAQLNAIPFVIARPSQCH